MFWKKSCHFRQTTVFEKQLFWSFVFCSFFWWKWCLIEAVFSFFFSLFFLRESMFWCFFDSEYLLISRKLDSEYLLISKKLDSEHLLISKKLDSFTAVDAWKVFYVFFGSFTEIKRSARFWETQQLCRKNKKLYCFLHLAKKTNEKS